MAPFSTRAVGPLAFISVYLDLSLLWSEDVGMWADDLCAPVKLPNPSFSLSPFSNGRWWHDGKPRRGCFWQCFTQVLLESLEFLILNIIIFKNRSLKKIKHVTWMYRIAAHGLSGSSCSPIIPVLCVLWDGSIGEAGMKETDVVSAPEFPQSWLRRQRVYFEELSIKEIQRVVLEYCWKMQ